MHGNIEVTQIRPGSAIWRVLQKKPVPANAYLVVDGDRLILVDGGSPDRPGEILAAVRQVEAATGRTLGAIAMTHGHRDHIGAIAEVQAATGVPVYAHPEEHPFLTGARAYGVLSDRRGYRVPQKTLGTPVPASALRALPDGGRLGPLLAVHTPGHAPGHLAFWHAEEATWLTGDILAHFVPWLWLHGPIWPFTYDIPMARHSARRLLEVGPFRALCFGHGAPLQTDAVRRLQGYLRRVGVH